MVDPLPWQAWRIKTANVDGTGGVTAHDAAKILKYAGGLIDKFPVEDIGKSAETAQADIEIIYGDGWLYFSSSGEIFGLNVFAHEYHDILGEPEFLHPGMLHASNIGEDNDAIGLATAQSPEENTILMKIPVLSTEGMNVKFDMVVNAEPKTETVAVTPTGIENVTKDHILIYPNPVNNELFVAGVEINSQISVFDLSGKQRLTLIATSAIQRVDVSTLESGIYIIKVWDNNFRRTARYVKH